MSNTLAPIFGLLVISFITPGPNNLIVMSAAARGGFRQAVPIITGIVLGMVIFYLLACVGLAQVLVMHPKVGNILLVMGGSYLTSLGLRAISLQTSIEPAGKEAHEPSLFGIALFQVLNPKSVILIATVAAATPDRIAMLPVIASVMALTAAACLTIWAIAGSKLSDWLLHPHRRRAFDVSMGLLLIASAVMLLFYGWKGMA